jgi:hypothetical protein
MTERDPHISGIWQAAEHPEPPAELDARILAAARQALAETKPKPRRRPWWRLALPFSATAVLVLAVTLLLRIEREAPERLHDAAPPPFARAPALAEADRQAKAEAPGRAQTAGAEATRPLSPAEVERMVAHPAATALTPARPAPSPEATGEAAGAAARQDLLASQPAAEARMQAAPAGESRELGQAKAARAPLAGPERAVERIRQLLRDGRRDEALLALAELRRQHPGFELPADLRDLHRPSP